MRVALPDSVSALISCPPGDGACEGLRLLICCSCLTGGLRRCLSCRSAQHSGRPGRLVVHARTLEPAVGLWATKKGMDQFFHPDGTCHACTILHFEPGNIVTQVRGPAGCYRALRNRQA